MTERELKLDQLYRSLDDIPRVDGVPTNSEDDARERVLLRAIHEYEAQCDLDEWKRIKGLNDA